MLLLVQRQRTIERHEATIALQQELLARERAATRDSHTALIRIGRLLSLQVSKRQLLPGPELLWRGCQHLRLYTRGWRVGRATADRTARSPPVARSVSRPGARRASLRDA